MRRIYTSSWRGFFRETDNVVALPSWAAPRLYIVSETPGQRWRDAGAFYPALSWKARLYKTLLRGAVASVPGRFGPRRPGDPEPVDAIPSSEIGGWRDALATRLDGRWPAFRQSALLRSFFCHYFEKHGSEYQPAGSDVDQAIIPPVMDATGLIDTWFPDADRLSVTVGAADDDRQKLIVRIIDRHGKMSGFVKHSVLSFARELTRNERRILKTLPAEAGPRVLGFEDGEQATMMAISPVIGRPWPACLPTGDGTSAVAYWAPVREYLNRLSTGAPVAIENHPAQRRIPEEARDYTRCWISSLKKRRWPVVVEHGDFTPWNFFRTKTGTAAIDWEDGEVEGFPYLDLVFWILQTGYFLHHWTPAQAFAYAVGRLRAEGLDTDEAGAVVRLAAVLAHAKSRRAGLRDDGRIQGFRRDVWSL